MKLAFDLKKKEASLQADVEGMIERGLERKEKIQTVRLGIKYVRKKNVKTWNLNEN